MFQFTTTNVINSAFEIGYTPSGNEELDNKKARFTIDDVNNTFNVKRVHNFKKEFVTDIFKTEGVTGIPAMARIEIPSEDKGTQLRLNIYIGLTQGSNSSFYSNDTYFKGKPLVIDFVAKDSAADTAKELEKIIKKFMINVQGIKMVEVYAVGAEIVIECVNEYQRFIKLNLEKYDETKHAYLGEFDVVKGIDDLEVINDPEALAADTVYKGREGFGTYSWILHNLRLPTDARTRFLGMNKEETPIPGELYNEYVIHYCVERGTLGNNAVGDQVTSHTTHVFYVLQSLAEKFEEGLAILHDIETVEPHGKL